MKKGYSDPSFRKEFLELQRDFPRFKALGFIYELWTHIGSQISATQLYNLYNNVEPACLDTKQEAFYCPNTQLPCYYPPELPIEICDSATLNAVKQRVNFLNNSLREARYNNDLAHAEDCETELATLAEYLKDCITSHKRLRYVNNLDRELYLLIYRSVQALYKAIEPQHPELVQFLKQHVVIGVKCYWSEEPIHSKAKPKHK